MLRGLPCLGSFSVVDHAHQAHRGPPRPPAGVLICRFACQALKRTPWVGSSSVVQCVRQLMGQPLYSSSHAGCGEREAMVMAPSPTPCFHGCPLFLQGHFPPHLLPYIASVSLSTVNSSPCPGFAPQSLRSSSQLLGLLGDLPPYPGCAWLRQELSVSHSILAAAYQLFHLLP